jgi:hypothetical protein
MFSFFTSLLSCVIAITLYGALVALVSLESTMLSTSKYAHLA